eukprot:13497323-Alexandrium_andersonii.AAC.1
MAPSGPSHPRVHCLLLHQSPQLHAPGAMLKGGRSFVVQLLCRLAKAAGDSRRAAGDGERRTSRGA